MCLELGVKAIEKRVQPIESFVDPVESRHHALVENSVHHYPEYRREGWDAGNQTELQARHTNNVNSVRFSLNCSL